MDPTEQIKLTLNPGCTMMVNNIEEEMFFLSHLKPEHDVLEWGAGMSTFAIAPKVKYLESIEHDRIWFDEMVKKRPENCRMHYVAITEPSAEYSDGTYKDCKVYINWPTIDILDESSPIIMWKKYDIIFIDGRARVECARISLQLLKPGGLIFIHDYRHPDEKYRRPEYEVVEEFLDLKERVFAMAMFTVKPHTNG
jgi:hypothetical protein